MLRNFFSLIRFRWNHSLSRFLVRRVPLDPSQEFVLLVDEARKEWQWTNNMFHEYNDKNLVDQAIYRQSAAERRYVHLLSQANREGIRADLRMIISLNLAAHNNTHGGVGLCRQKYGRLF